MSADKEERERQPKRQPPGPKQLVSEATVTQSRCKNCGSTSRMDYANVRSMIHDNVKTEWKNTRCSDCGQCRVDIFKTTIKDDAKEIAAVAE